MASEQVREVQERRRSGATMPHSKSEPLGNLAAIAEQLADMEDDEQDNVPCGSGYCTREGCFDAQGKPI